MRLTVFILALLVAFPLFAEEITGNAVVKNGDTIKIGTYHIRLHGIDALDFEQFCSAGGQRYPCGKKAALALREKINGPVRCVVKDKDYYDRFVAKCYQNGEGLNAWMVSQGHAVAYRKYSTDYIPNEQVARKARRGIWRGSFEYPWNWREANR